MRTKYFFPSAIWITSGTAFHPRAYNDFGEKQGYCATYGEQYPVPEPVFSVVWAQSNGLATGLIEVCTGECFGLDDTVNGTNVLHHGFGDGGQILGFQLHDQIVVTKQHRCIRYVGKISNAAVDLLFRAGLDVDEDVPNRHDARVQTVGLSTSPFR